MRRQKLIVRILVIVLILGLLVPTLLTIITSLASATPNVSDVIDINVSGCVFVPLF